MKITGSVGLRDVAPIVIEMVVKRYQTYVFALVPASILGVVILTETFFKKKALNYIGFASVLIAAAIAVVLIFIVLYIFRFLLLLPLIRTGQLRWN